VSARNSAARVSKSESGSRLTPGAGCPALRPRPNGHSAQRDASTGRADHRRGFERSGLPLFVTLARSLAINAFFDRGPGRADAGGTRRAEGALAEDDRQDVNDARGPASAATRVRIWERDGLGIRPRHPFAARSRRLLFEISVLPGARARGANRLHPSMRDRLWQPGQSGNPTGRGGLYLECRRRSRSEN
jgi:hypothetical protein